MMAMRPLNEVVEALEQKHSQDQDTIADNLALGLYPLWNIVDFNRLDETTIWWTESVLPRVKTAYLQSQRVAAAFAANVRFASLPNAEPLRINAPMVENPMGVPVVRFELPEFGSTDSAIDLDPFPEDDVRLSLLVEGNYNIKSQMPVPEGDVMPAARANSTGAAIRQSLKGARNVTNNVVQFDRKVLGFARYTDVDPCHFCALLASRGAVYGRGSFADTDSRFRANEQATDVPRDYVRISKVHNHCRCTLRPVYSKSQAFDADAKFYRAQWNRIFEENMSRPPKEIVQVWRDNYKPFQRKEPDVVKLQSALREREKGLLREGFSPVSPQVQWAQRTQSLLAAS